MKLGKWVAIAVVIVCSFAGLVWLLGLSGVVAAFFWSVLILVLTNPDRAMQIFASLLTSGRKFHFWFERTKVEKFLEGTIGLCSKRINEEGLTLLPHGVDIKWVEPVDRGAFLKENKVIVCLESSYNEAKNLARATMLYVAEDLIRKSRRFVEPLTMKSADFVVARKMLMMDRRLDAIRYLNEEFIKPEADKRPEVALYVSSMEKMDVGGHFTRILLREFSELDTRLPPSLPSDTQVEAETLSFTQMLKELVEKKKGVDVYPTHRGQVIRVSIMPIARSETRPDPARYVDWAKKCLNDQIPVIYVVARGINIPLAEWVIEEIEKKGIYERQHEWKYKIPYGRHGVNSYVAVLSKI